MDYKPSFAVLGAGNGGVATAADLTVRGFKVNLWEHPDFADTIRPIQERGGIELKAVEGIPVRSGFARLNKATTNIVEALDGVDAVLVIVPAFAHKSVSECCAPYLQDHQIVVISPGNFGGAVQFRNAFLRSGHAKDVVFAEAECMIYACRKTDPSTIFIRRYKKALRYAALPATQTPRVMEIIHQIYPEAEAAANVLETGLSNPNPTQHPPIMILNAGLIERTGGDFLFYNEGVTHGVVNVIDAVDRERIAVCAALKTTIRSAFEQELAWYGYQGASGTNLYESMNGNPYYSTSKAPKSFQDRYLTEDIPFGLVPVEELGKLVGVPTPIATSIINFAELLTERPLRENRRSLEALGLGGMSVEELLSFVNG
ncbi:MAG: NAD/NADP octopine/nopaline dehydrogenase family protein [Hominicoprocola sp.]